MIELSKCDGQIITDDGIKNMLEGLGIRKGDTICVHSELMGFGKPLLGKSEYIQSFILIFQDMIGETGTLLMPAFSYSFCAGRDYDVIHTPSRVGILSEAFRKSSHVARTEHPIFSFAVWGKNKEEYLDIGLDAFGMDSVYGNLIHKNGKVIMFGANKGYTIYHLAEEHVGVPHRYFKNFSGNIIDGKGKKKYRDVPYYVRYLDKKSIADERKIECFLLENHIQKQKECARATIGTFYAKDGYEAFVKQLRIDSSYFLEDG